MISGIRKLGVKTRMYIGSRTVRKRFEFILAHVWGFGLGRGWLANGSGFSFPKRVYRYIDWHLATMDAGSNSPATTTANTATRPQRTRRRRRPPNSRTPTAAAVEEDAKTGRNGTVHSVPPPRDANAPPTTDSAAAAAAAAVVQRPEPTPTAIQKKKKNTRRKKNSTNKLQATTTTTDQQQQHPEENDTNWWWSAQIPPDTVDPITLDPLHALPYPPFALAGAAPYGPTEWPSSPTSSTNADKHVSEDDRQQQILRNQWGAAALRVSTAASAEPVTASPSLTTTTSAAAAAAPIIDSLSKEEATKSSSNPTKNITTTPRQHQQQQHVNLFDGRALAYYMVSQLQFIDPLNRRDLLRDELVHLDQYLRRHGFFDLNVTEAYDVKGISLSTAGSVANTTTGRATILQEQARVLLNSLFGGGGGSTSAVAAAGTNTRSAAASITQQSMPSNRNNTNVSRQNRFRLRYEAHETSQQQHDHGSQYQNTRNDVHPDHVGVYGESGWMIIDDDENPGLRGNAREFVPASAASSVAPRRPPVVHDPFPSLTASTDRLPLTVANPADDPRTKQRELPKAKTLSKIGKLIQKTNPEELQRQWEAREEARRRAMLSGMPPPSLAGTSVEDGGTAQGVPLQITTTNDNGPTEALLDRNRAFAEALGVLPATLRLPVRGGWTRPSVGQLQVDEFGNELNSTLYPDSLMRQARELRLDVLLKLEKKWKAFLADDSAASLPLYPMIRSIRAFVHEYAEYWKLHTESFDPEPKRYIHCVKLRETSAPHPLLTDALRNWRPGQQAPHYVNTHGIDHSQQQTTGQPTRGSRELPAGPSRVPLSLLPRTGAGIEHQPTNQRLSTVGSLGGAPSRSMVETDAATTNSRFSALFVNDRERPKLDLQKRTLPLEIPPASLAVANGQDTLATASRMRDRMQSKAQREQMALERKQRAIAAAFDSDDDDDDDNGHAIQKRGHSNYDSGSESDWEEQTPAFIGND